MANFLEKLFGGANSGVMPPFPWNVRRSASGRYGFSVDNATVTSHGELLLETVEGQTAIHPGGRPDNPLVLAVSRLTRVSGPGGIQFESGSSAATSFVIPEAPAGTSGSFSVGSLPEELK